MNRYAKATARLAELESLTRLPSLATICGLSRCAISSLALAYNDFRRSSLTLFSAKLHRRTTEVPVRS
jgi:hypothetical protein